MMGVLMKPTSSRACRIAPTLPSIMSDGAHYGGGGGGDRAIRLNALNPIFTNSIMRGLNAYYADSSKEKEHSMLTPKRRDRTKELVGSAIFLASDAFTSLKKTRWKFEVSFWDHLQGHLSKSHEIPPLLKSRYISLILRSNCSVGHVVG